jgi:hypothetical protein
MSDTEPQTAGGKVLWHFTMSLDGFVAGPGHQMDWLTGISFRPGLAGEYVTTTGAVLGGRDGGDHAISGGRPCEGAWDGPIFVLTHHPRTRPRPPESRSSAVIRPRRCGSAGRRPAARTSRCSHRPSAGSFSHAG